MMTETESIILVLIVFFIGLAVAAIWHYFDNSMFWRTKEDRQHDREDRLQKRIRKLTKRLEIMRAKHKIINGD